MLTDKNPHIEVRLFCLFWSGFLSISGPSRRAQMHLSSFLDGQKPISAKLLESKHIVYGMVWFMSPNMLYQCQELPSAPLFTPGIAPGLIFSTPKLAGCNIFVAHDPAIHKYWILRYRAEYYVLIGLSYCSIKSELVARIPIFLQTWRKWRKRRQRRKLKMKRKKKI